MQIESLIRTVPNWPKPGIMFRDITTLLQNPTGFQYCLDQLVAKFSDLNANKIAGIEARGFIFGAAIAAQLRLPFVPIRKPGKLPAETVYEDYSLEYGTNRIEVHKDAVDQNDRVIIVDDLLATGGTALAAAALIERLGAEVAAMGFVVNLPELGGLKALSKYRTHYLVEFDGE